MTYSLLDALFERTLGTVDQTVRFFVKVELTDHGEGRYDRHGDSPKDVITDTEIKDLAQKCIGRAARALMSGKLELGDTFIVVNERTLLNMSCALYPKAQDLFELRIVTVYRGRDFRIGRNQLVFKTV